MIRTVHVRISGRVQGVGYRCWMQEEATALDLSGWVRNRRDGTVEAVIRGTRDAVEDMLARCGRGPPSAEVTDVAATDTDDVVPEPFEIRPTG